MFLYSASGKLVATPPIVEHFKGGGGRKVNEVDYFMYLLYQDLFRKHTVAQLQQDLAPTEQIVKDIDFKAGMLVQTQRSVADSVDSLATTITDSKKQFNEQRKEFEGQKATNLRTAGEIKDRIEDLKLLRSQVTQMEETLAAWERHVDLQKQQRQGLALAPEEVAIAEQYVQDTRRYLESARSHLQAVDTNIKDDQDLLQEAQVQQREAQANLATNIEEIRKSLRDTLTSTQKLLDTIRPQFQEVIQPFDAQYALVLKYVQHGQEIERVLSSPNNPKDRDAWIRALQETNAKRSTLSLLRLAPAGTQNPTYPWTQNMDRYVNNLNYKTYYQQATSAMSRLLQVKPLIDELKSKNVYIQTSMERIPRLLSQL